MKKQQSDSSRLFGAILLLAIFIVLAYPVVVMKVVLAICAGVILGEVFGWLMGWNDEN